MRPIQKLQKLAIAFQQDDVSFDQISEQVEQYKKLLFQLAEIDNNKGRNDVYMPTGKAIGTTWAVLCLDDVLRTRQFIRGVMQAVEHLLKQKPKVHLLYAGTGPFAPLILPALAHFPKGKISCSLLEINDYSFATMQKVINQLGLESTAVEMVQTDASTFQISDEYLPDLIISETMQAALKDEQQVSIFLNLMRQVPEDCLFIPQAIQLSLGIFEFSDELSKPVAPLFEVSRNALQTQLKTTTPASFEAVEVQIQKKDFPEKSGVYILTDIHIYGQEWLRINHSGLTVPILQVYLDMLDSDQILVKAQYIINENPKLDVQIQPVVPAIAG